MSISLFYRHFFKAYFSRKFMYLNFFNSRTKNKSALKNHLAKTFIGKRIRCFKRVQAMAKVGKSLNCKLPSTHSQ